VRVTESRVCRSGFMVWPLVEGGYRVVTSSAQHISVRILEC